MKLKNRKVDEGLKVVVLYAEGNKESQPSNSGDCTNTGACGNTVNVNTGVC